MILLASLWLGGAQNRQSIAQDAANASADGEMTITVTDAESGSPVEGVRLRLDGWIGERLREELRTDKDGRAILKWQKGAEIRLLWMDVLHAGHVPQSHLWRNGDNGDTDVELPRQVALQLDRGQKAGGVVTGADGKPIAGVSVQITMPITAPKLAAYRFTAAELTTGNDGRWVWDGAPRNVGTAGASYEKDGYLRSGGRLQDGLANSTVLKRGLSVTGRVTDEAGKPVVGATLQLGRERFGTGEPKTLSDEDGKFELLNCKPGPTLITVQAARFSPQVQELTVNDETQPVVFSLKLGHVLRGRVVDKNGKPVSGVIVDPDSWNGIRTLEQRMTTGPDGRFEWNGAPADIVRYSIRKQGYMAHRGYELNALVEDHVVTMHPLLVISGTVTDTKSGQPLANFAIREGYQFLMDARVYWSRDEPIAFRDGKFSRSFGEPMEKRFLQVVARGYLPATSRAFRSDEGQVVFDFKLTPGTGPTGTVLLADGKPAVGADVALFTQSSRGSLRDGRFQRGNSGIEQVKADDKGTFEFLPIDGDESFLVVAIHDLGIAMATNKQLEESAELKLKKWGRLLGRARIGDKPYPDAIIQFALTMPQGVKPFLFSQEYTVRADKQGFFRFSRVTPGDGVIARRVVTEFGDNSSSYTYGWQTPVIIGEDETAKVDVGGTGRAVIGEIALDWKPEKPIDWTAHLPVRLNPLNQSEGQTSATYLGRIDTSGRFTIPDVRPGKYRLLLAVMGRHGLQPGPGVFLGSAMREVEVTAAETEGDARPIDLGKVTVKRVPKR
jgi:hypothetical protein